MYISSASYDVFRRRSEATSLPLARENFELLPGYRVNQIMLSRDNRAEGATIQRRGGNTDSIIRGAKEVILAAALHTLVIMQRSGIGPRKVLEGPGIDVRVELPGVGMNLQDHPAAGSAYGWAFTPEASYTKS